MSWEPSAQADTFGGCRFCLHYQGGGRCTAFPSRIPLPIFAGDIDHMVVRPSQVGDDVFEALDLQYWLKTRERRVLAQAPPARSTVRSRPR